jgi:uncharacterized protein (TIRG00374 family)
MGRLGGVVIGVAMSVAAAVWLVATTDLGEVARLSRVEVVWLAPGLLVLAVQAWIRGARWASLLRASADRPVPASRVVDAMLVGYFVNAVLPGRVGEVARALIVSRRESVGFGLVAASVVVERAIDVMALSGLVAAALAVTASGWSVAIAGLGLAIAAVLALGRRAPVLERLVPRRMPARAAAGIRDFLGAVAAIPARVMGSAAALSILAWLGDATLVLLVARALGFELDPAAALAIGLGGALGTALPAAPGYLATYELGAVTLGSLAGVPADTVLPIALLTHLIGVGVLALAGAVALGRVSGSVRLDQLRRTGPINLAPDQR